MASSLSFGRVVLCGIWFPVITASIGVSYQALLITGKRQEYVSLGQLGVPEDSQTYQDSVSDKTQHTPNLHATSIAILEGSPPKREALERVNVLNPGLVKCEIGIRVTESKKGSKLFKMPNHLTIFDISVTGAEPKFTRYFLDSLLDEFRSMINAQLSPETPGSDGRGDLCVILQHATPAIENIQDWRLPIGFAILQWGGAGLALVLLVAKLISGKSDSSIPLPLPKM